MNTERSRDEFESWAAIKFEVDVDLLIASRTEESMDDGFPYRIVNKHGEESDLVNTLVGAAWAGWQASRAALTIKLPAPMKGPNIDDENDDYEQFEMHEAVACEVNSMLSKCRKAVESLGLKVKP